MVQFKILSGKKAGSLWEARRFPVRIGRAANANLQIEEAGVWDEHLRVSVESEGFVLETQGSALAGVNGQPVQRAALRNGDVIEMGSARLQFWLSEARQRGQGFREAFVWTLVVLICFSQIALVYWLLTGE
jgi:pSer/pThr/pTyr-binding forkhead associated (FHA) protein